MCGIFGIYANSSTKLNQKLTTDIVKKLFLLSETRGKESSGIAIKNTCNHRITVFKKSVPASKLIHDSQFKKYFEDSIQGIVNENKCLQSFALMAHARLVTNGTQENNNNNQPVIKAGRVAVHNGIITNVENLWEKYPHLNRQYEVDTEILLSLITNNFQNGKTLIEATIDGFSKIEGTASISIFSEDTSTIILATNNGSIYYTLAPDNSCLLFASEGFILEKAIKELKLDNLLGLHEVMWMQSGTGLSYNLINKQLINFSFKEVNPELAQLDACGIQQGTTKDEVVNFSPDKPIDINLIGNFSVLHNRFDKVKQSLEYNINEIKSLQRCSKCVLPSTFPFIEFDEKGICNYCKSYVVKRQGVREEEFKTLMKQYQSKNGKPDCIIPFSGGRDSSYGLHYIVHELGMKPITYTYDWGMVTDLARRNIARICGKLGLENIIVSADITKKRRNIRLNVEAWLRKPQLGMIPLFMAGDKQFFYFVNQIKKQTGIKLDIWSTNILENTDFKVGFCGVKPHFDKTRPDHLPLANKVKLAWYYLRNFIITPSYLNASIPDTLASFYSYYAEPRRHFYQLFDWIEWNEKKIEQTLYKEYNWELSPDTITSWRIGDGTASFYNYIYYTVTGFSEFDTFRSNQIREGLITREFAINRIYDENRPRFESMIWYFDTIGINIEKAIQRVNQIPKLYRAD